MYRYWGKWSKRGYGAHLLVYHCLDVAAVFQAYLEANPKKKQDLLAGFSDPDEAMRWLIWIVVMHDLGKFSPTFQGLVPEAVEAVGGISRPVLAPGRHDEIGLLAISELEDSLLNGESYLFESLIYASMGHHGSPVGGGIVDLSSHLKELIPADVKRDMLAFGSATKSLLGVPTKWAGLSRPLAKEKSFLLAGLIVLADWVASNSRLFNMQTREVPLEIYWARTQAQADEAIARLGLQHSEPKGPISFQDQFKHIDQPTPLQSTLSDLTLTLASGPQLFILESITGDGKTEASMRLVHKLMAAGLAEGFYLAMPTMATSNAMYERLRTSVLALFENPELVSFVLAQSSRRIHKEFQDSILEPFAVNGHWPEAEHTELASVEARCNAWFADHSKKSLLAQCGIGTIDQAMLAVMSVKHQSLRLAGLHRKVLVIDEVHASDAYMHTIIQRLLEFHAAAGGSAILLSATLPMKMRQELTDAFRKGLADKPGKLVEMSYPLITHIQKGYKAEIPVSVLPSKRKKTHIKRISSGTDALDLLIEWAKQGKCACWVRNTVTDAIDAFNRLSARMAEESLDPTKAMLFHARFTMGDKLNIEGEIISHFGKHSRHEDRAGRIVIATQVVEQSLDIDFDELVSDLAPMDLLMQRDGRRRRHFRDWLGNPLPASLKVEEDGRGASILHILSPDPDGIVESGWVWSALKGSALIYRDHAVLWRTMKLLQDAGEMTVPDDSRYLIEATFNGEIETPSALGYWEDKADQKADCDKSLAIQNILEKEAGYAASRAWANDTDSPTRLGEASITVKLACWDGARLTPWGYEGTEPPTYLDWAVAEVKTRRTKLASPCKPDSPLLASKLAEAMLSLPDQGEYGPIMPMTKLPNGSWRGYALDWEGHSHAWHYDAKIGFRRA